MIHIHITTLGPCNKTVRKEKRKPPEQKPSKILKPNVPPLDPDKSPRLSISPNASPFERNGFTSLMLAVVNGNIDEVKTLLTNRETNPNIKSLDKGDTALHWAVRAQKPDVVKVLCEHNDIDLSIKNNNGRTPLELAQYLLGATSNKDYEDYFNLQECETELERAILIKKKSSVIVPSAPPPGSAKYVNKLKL